MNNVNPRFTQKQTASDISECKFQLDTMEKQNHNFGEWLKAELEKAKIKPAQLATLVGKSRQHNGNKTPSR